MLWNTRLETARSYCTSDSIGFVKSCFRNEVLESIPKDFMLFAAFSIEIPDMLPSLNRSFPVELATVDKPLSHLSEAEHQGYDQPSG